MRPIYPDVPSLAHRGLWSTPAERNSMAAFSRAFARGFGAELDVRDLAGSLVVSHDPPAEGALALEAVIDSYLACDCPGPLALNVKADGLGQMLLDALRPVHRSNWFAFDMSVPDMRLYARAGIPFFTRHSDIEPDPALYEHADGVWLDDFCGGFVTQHRIAAHLENGKRVAVVSPQLHRREHAPVWDEWRTWSVWRAPGVLLCTDDPAGATEVFT